MAERHKEQEADSVKNEFFTDKLVCLANIVPAAPKFAD